MGDPANRSVQMSEFGAVVTGFSNQSIKTVFRKNPALLRVWPCENQKGGMLGRKRGICKTGCGSS